MKAFIKQIHTREGVILYLYSFYSSICLCEAKDNNGRNLGRNQDSEEETHASALHLFNSFFFCDNISTFSA